MKRFFALLCGAALLLTACGAGKETEKDHYYEVLDSTGAVLYTVEDGELADTLDGLLATPWEDMETAGPAEDIEPLYTYVYCQEETLLAGEDPNEERGYEELMRILVPAEGEAAVIQILPDIAAANDLNIPERLAEAAGLEELLSSAVTVTPETAAILRAPERPAEK